MPTSSASNKQIRTITMRKTIFWMLAATLTSGMMLTSCTNNDNPVDPQQQKRAVKVTSYIQKGDDYEINDIKLFTYDAMGRIVECKYINNKESLTEKMTYTYSAGCINLIDKIYPNLPDGKVVVLDADFETDSNGRIVKMTTYSFSEPNTREYDDNPSVTLFTYDEQGHLIQRVYDDASDSYEWQDGELRKVIQYQNNKLFREIFYEPSDVPAKNLSQFKTHNLYEWLEVQGYFGPWSSFMPAKVIDKIYNEAEMLFTTDEHSHTYETTDGLVTTWYDTGNLDFPLYHITQSYYGKNIIEWE